jgi:NAD(P)H-dependent FMN reductase
MVMEAGGVVLASPEYHGSFAAMTKLVIENMGFPSATGDVAEHGSHLSYHAHIRSA